MSKKTTQRESNPFRFSDTNKRYYTYEYYCRRSFGTRLAKIPLDASLSCPNIDRGGGCIYCSGRGSGDCIPCGLSLREQYESGRRTLSSKWDTSHAIAYLQAHTNTYAPIEVLSAIYEEVLTFEGLSGMSIATRADCVGEEVCKLLASVARRTPLTVELGLQSSSDATAELIGRGHSYAEFVDGFVRLRQMVEGALICVHIIFGLPGEGREDMLRTVRDVAALHPDQIKIHLLHIIKDTPLAEMYYDGRYTPMEREDYILTVAEALTLLPEDIVICRLTGDGLAEELVAPLYSRRKTAIINDIDKLMFEKNWWQGKFFMI